MSNYGEIACFNNDYAEVSVLITQGYLTLTMPHQFLSGRRLIFLTALNMLVKKGTEW